MWEKEQWPSAISAMDISLGHVGKHPTQFSLFMANYCFVACLIVSLLFLNFVLKFCLVKIDVFYISSDPCIVYPVGATTKLYPICHL